MAPTWSQKPNMELFMFKSHALLRSVFLGSAVAITALAPAIAGDASREAAKRTLALYDHRAVAHVSTDGKAAPASNDPTYTDLYKFKGGTNDGCNPGAKVTLDDDGNIY